MIGIFLVTHGTLGESLIQCACHVLNKRPPQIAQPGHVEGIAGVNLPMLLRVLTYRDRDMPTLLQRAVSGGCDGVLHIKQG